MNPHPRTVCGDLADPPQALSSLCAERRWLVWRWQQKNGAWTKPPYCAAAPDTYALNNDPGTWATRGMAVAAVLAGKAHGIGYALMDSDIAAIDLDKCRDPDTGEIDDWARMVIDSVPGAYTEVTVSGTGLRVIGLGAGQPVHLKFSVPGERSGAAVELYRKATRYITVSGAQLGNGALSLVNIDDLIDRLLAHYEQADAHEHRNNAAGSGFAGDDDIDELIRNGAPEGQRSEAFARVVWSLAATGGTVDEIVTLLERHPDGIAAKYIKRLRRQVEQCYRKWERSQAKQNSGTADQSRDRTATLVRAGRLDPESIDWAWPNRFAFGKLALLAGDPGLGKSTLLIEIAALHSRGGAFPCGEGTARHCEVVILTAEDGLRDTVVPRLMAAGADLSKIHILTGTRAANSENDDLFDLTRDIGALRDVFEQHPGIRVLIIDPITAYLGPTKANENAAVRRVLAPLISLIEEFGVLAIGNNHLNKQSGKALYRVLDSIAFVAVGRIVHLVAKDADDADTRKFLCDKTNIGHKPLGLTYTIQSCPITGRDGQEIETSRISWGSILIDESADEALNTEQSDPTMTGDAVEFLQIVLADGPMAVLEIEREAREARVLGEEQQIQKSKPFRSAKKILGITSHKEGLTGGWRWQLPPKAAKVP